MNIFEIISDNCKSKNYLAEGWQTLTESQKRVIRECERELWPLMEELVSLFESRLNPEQIEKLFTAAEETSTDKLTRAGRAGQAAAGAAELGADTIKKVNQKINELGKKLQDTAPVKNFDSQFEKIKQDIKKKAGDDSKIIKQVEKYGNWAKENPGKSAFVIGVLTAAAAFAGGPAGGAAAGLVLRSANEMIKGEKASSAVGKAAKTAAVGALAGMAFDAIGDSVVDNIAAAGDEDLVDMIDSFDKANLESAMDGIPPEYASLLDELEGARTVRMSGNVNNFFYNYDVVLPPDLYEQFAEMENSIKEIRSQTGTFSEEAMAETARFHDFMAEIQNDPMQEQYRGALAALEAAQSQAENLSTEQLEQLVAGLDNLEDKVDALSKADAAIASAVQAATQEAASAAENAVKASPVKSDSEKQSESIHEDLKSKIKGAASNVKKQATQAVTKQKLMKSWQKQGKPLDYGSVVKIMQNQGLSTDEISRVSQAAKVELPVKSQVKGIKPGETVKGPDGDSYNWKGAQWINKSTGRAAKKDVAQKLTKTALAQSQQAATRNTGVDLNALAKQIKQAGLSDEIKKLLQN